MKFKHVLGFALTVFAFSFSSCSKQPAASVSASASEVEINESVSFTNNTTFGDTYIWDFGDGTTSTEKSPSHSWSETGNYTVELTAYNGNKIDKATAAIKVDKSGCMDADSEEYDPLATKDDGSCTYSGSVVFWYGKEVADTLVAIESSSLKFYVDGDLAGSQSADVYYPSAPSCEQNSIVKYEYDLGSDKEVILFYQVIDDWDDVLWEGDVTISANTCLRQELTLTNRR